MNYQKKPRQKYIKCLERRMDYLGKRVGGSGIDLSYDKAELNALKWAVDSLKEIFPNQEISESEDQEVSQ